MNHNFKNYKNHIFDCDGVILDSNKIKGDIFFKVAQFFSPDHADKLLQFHQKNGGLNRKKKFEHFFEIILNQTQYKSDLEKALQLFQTYNLEETKKAAVVGGFESFLKSLPDDSKKLVVSAGDHQDLLEILRHKNLLHLFDSVWGGPTSKQTIIENLKLEGTSIFYGDSEVDYNTALHFNFDFVFISGVCSWPDWENNLKGKDIRIAKDFNEIIRTI